MRIDVATDAVEQVILLPEDVTLQGTYLNDMRFSPDGATSYITDSGTRRAIIVIDLQTGKGFRALDGHASTQVEKGVAFAADGIALSNDRGTLYWQALTGRTPYSTDTGLLRPEVSEDERAAGVVRVATTHVADGLWMSREGVLYLTSPTDFLDHAAGRRRGGAGAGGSADALARHLPGGAGRADLRHREPHPGPVWFSPARRLRPPPSSAPSIPPTRRAEMAYLRYAAGIETPEPDEQATIAGIVTGMSGQLATVKGRQGHAVRPSHAKSTACGVGTMEVARPAGGAGPGAVRPRGQLRRGGALRPGARRDPGDRVSTHRRMSIKVFGAEG